MKLTGRMIRGYHALPSWAWSFLATARGYQLKRWRYGAGTDAMVRAAIEREHWDEAAWERWRQPRLEALLRRAVERVPYYRDYWSQRRSDAWKQLENWPILEKESVRANPLAFLADDCDPRAMFPEHTSGSTGSPVRLWWSRETTQSWYALFEARWRGWYGVSRRDRWAILGGQRVVPAGRKEAPFWVWNAAMSQLYMSVFHMRPEVMTAYLDALERYKIRYLWGYPSAMHQLALAALSANRRVPLRVAIANAEPLNETQRASIEAAFGCPARETYGMAEIVTAAGECEFGTMHVWPDVGVLELLEAGRPTAPGEPGDVVATGLANPDMPLVRYRTGDRAVAAESGSRCACGRNLPALARIEGRIDDYVVTADGRKLGRLDMLLKGNLPVRQAQIVQRVPGEVEVRVVAGEGFTPAHAAEIQRSIRDYAGALTVSLTLVPDIPLTSGGKHRFVVSAIAGQ